jgi:hypothetical protein
MGPGGVPEGAAGEGEAGPGMEFGRGAILAASGPGSSAPAAATVATAAGARRSSIWVVAPSSRAGSATTLPLRASRRPRCIARLPGRRSSA